MVARIVETYEEQYDIEGIEKVAPKENVTLIIDNKRNN